MSFGARGFSSPVIDRLRSDLRDVPGYRPWFEFTDDLTRLGLDLLSGLAVPLNDNQRLCIAALFIRAHKSFQSAVLLAERGLLGDARVVLRSAVEGAIALNALANDQAFVQGLIDAHCHWQRKTAGMALRDPEYRMTYSPAEIAAMEATISEVNLMETGGTTIRDINWADVAAKHCRDLYQLVYRQLSADGTHTNINTIHRMIRYDAAKQPVAFKVGPDTDGMVGTLQAACLMFLWALGPFGRAFDSQTDDQIQEQLRRFSGLPQTEPEGVSVVGNSA